jgi:hypothetical protein
MKKNTKLIQFLKREYNFLKMSSFRCIRKKCSNAYFYWIVYFCILQWVYWKTRNNMKWYKMKNKKYHTVAYKTLTEKQKISHGRL